MSFGFGFGFPKNYIATLFNPAQLFTGTTNGAWYDPSDINLTWRRNLLTYSEQFDNAAWGKTANASVTANFDAAPDGSITADRFVSTGGAFPQTAQVVNNLVAGQAYTFSVWVKSDGTQQIAQSILLESGITTFIPTSTWTRVSVTVASSAGGSRSVVIATNSGSAPSSSFIIWGAQLEVGSTATAYQRITDGIKDYLDYKPLPILYQDAAGTTPVTAVGQPVGLMLDKSKGLVLGPELVTNGDFSQGTTGWTATNSSITTVNGELQLTNSGTSYGVASTTVATTIGRTYKVTMSARAVTAASANLNVKNNSPIDATVIASLAFTTQDTKTVYFSATATTTYICFVNTNQNNGTAFYDNISVRELPGNHAFNPSGNSANFPVLSARYNLLTKTEDFSDAAWIKNNWSVSTNSSVAPDGSMTADKMVENTVDGFHATYYAQSLGTVTGNYSYSVYLKNAGRSWANIRFNGVSTWFDIANGAIGTIGSGITASISSTGNGWYRCTVSAVVVSVAISPEVIMTKGDLGGVYTGDGTSGIYIWGADLRVSNDALNQPAYQRVNTATDYDTVGFKPYLSFNGVNQWLQTNSIDFTYGDKMFVSAGIRKLSDAAVNDLDIVVELSTASETSNGAFSVLSSNGWGGSQKTAQINSRGTAITAAESTNAAHAAPITYVLSGIGNISGDQAILRVNGTQAAISTADQGTGNYGNYPLYIGARAGSSLFFNGRLYQLIVADGGYNQYALEDDNLFLLEDGTAMLTEYGANPGPTVIAAVESFVNQKTGAY